MDDHPAYFGAELREPIEPGLSGRPVILRDPIPAQLLQIRQRNALRPILDRHRVRPPGRLQPTAQVINLSVGHREGKRRHAAVAADRVLASCRRLGHCITPDGST